MNLVALVGARPQIIKHSAIERAVKRHFSEQIELITIHSGQHYSEEMSAIFFEEMGIDQPDLNLQVGSSSHALQTAKMMEKLDVYLDEHPCDAFLVYGDTNSTLAGALVASKRHIPVIHIEAGLRSFDKSMPEEINRIMTDHVSSMLFCPTDTAVVNLKNEHILHHPEGTINSPSVYKCGDIMFDNSMHFAKVAEEKCTILQKYHLSHNAYLLATVHRDSNTDTPEKLQAIFSSFLEIIQIYQLEIILPLHPRTQKCLNTLPTSLQKEIEAEEKLRMIDPVGFLEMIVLEKNARLILTDSGGVQKEAYFFQKPAVILRPHTEWIEIVENGCAETVDTDRSRILNAVHSFIKQDNLQFPPVFGDGKAAEFILKQIVQ